MKVFALSGVKVVEMDVSLAIVPVPPVYVQLVNVAPVFSDPLDSYDITRIRCLHIEGARK